LRHQVVPDASGDGQTGGGAREREGIGETARVILSEAKEPYPDAWLLRFAQDDSLSLVRLTA